MTGSPCIGFISPPAWQDPAPAEFPSAAAEPVRTQQAPLLMPGFDYALDAIASAQDGLAAEGEAMASYGWAMTDDIVRQSIAAAADAAPGAEAVVVAGSGTRTLRILGELEARAGCPVVAADTVLYWAVARLLGLTPAPVPGSLAGLPRRG